MGQFFTPRNLLRIIWRRLPIMLLVLMIGLPAVVYYALNQPRVFEASAVIQIEPPQVVQTATQTAGPSADRQLDQIQAKLTSRDNLIEIVTRLNLFPETESMSERVGDLRDSLEIIKLIDPAQQFRPDVQPTGLIIRVQMGDADQAAQVANDLTNSILAEAAQRAEERAIRTLDFFTDQEQRVTAEITVVEDEISAFKLTNAGSLPSDLTAQRDLLNTYREQMLALEREIIELETSVDRLRGEDADRQIALLEGQRNLIQGSIDAVEADLAAAPDVAQDLAALDRRLTQLEAEYETITTNRTEAVIREQLESQDQVERFEILEEALPPEVSISTSRRKLAMAGGVLVGFLALGLGFLMEISRPVIRNASQLEAQLGIQPVITVPHITSRVQRQRRVLGFMALAGGLVALPMLLLGGLRDVVMRLFGGGSPASP